MKKIIQTTETWRITYRATAILAAALVALTCLPMSAGQGQGRGNESEGNGNGRGGNGRGERNKAVHYRQVNLVSDQAGVAALQDENLVNAWGVAFGATGPFWVSANGTGLAVLYSVTNDSSGIQQVTKLALEVTIPGEGNPTGQVFNNTTGFNGDLFLFVSEDGTISGWRPALGTAAEVLATRETAVYKGVTIASGANGPLLLAANFSEGTLDVYDSNMSLVGQFTDRRAPEGYAPFNVQILDGMVFVTFAKQDEDKEDDVPGPGHGLIDIFDVRHGKLHRLVTGSDAGGKLTEIDSPWGLTLSPNSHGELLVGNFGSGTIMRFDDHGKFRGLLLGEDDQPIVIDGLWALTEGNGGLAGSPGNLYFTAGPEDETHGLFGSLEPINRHDD